MKQILFSLFLLIIVGCSPPKQEFPQYTVNSEYIIPDSLKQQHQEYILKLTSAASYHMTGGDYEHPSKTIKQAQYTADNLFGIKIFVLYKRIDHYKSIMIPYNQMDTTELRIYNDLIYNK
jgi:hypothetical protein